MVALTNEIDILAQIDHPNVVKLLEVYQDSKSIYMVFELMKGGELTDRIEESGKYNEDQAKGVIKAVVDAMHYCHQHGIVHRDLKPENLLYETVEEESIIKISDFGFARLIDNKECRCCYLSPHI